MNETYKLPFTAEEIEDKLTNGCGLELIGTFNNPLGFRDDSTTALNYYPDVNSELIQLLQSGQVRAMLVRCSQVEYASISWSVTDTAYFQEAGDIDFVFGYSGECYAADWVNDLVYSIGIYDLELYR